MIAPLVAFPLRGVIWYQGESNTRRAYQYRSLFPALIEDWRAQWDAGNIPFLFVQLANFGTPQENPNERVNWAELREAQRMALLEPNTGMAVAIDIGETDDVHARNKQDVGKRLALNALANVYGRSVAFSGPVYRGMQREGGQIRLLFGHAGRGLVAKDDALKGFAVAGPDRHFVWADAHIEGGTVVVSSPEVEDPVAVRYAWGNSPEATLYNEAGLPASPFRTDDWLRETWPEAPE